MYYCHKLIHMYYTCIELKYSRERTLQSWVISQEAVRAAALQTANIHANVNAAPEQEFLHLNIILA